MDYGLWYVEIAIASYWKYYVFISTAYRVEDLLLEKIEKKRPQRQTNMECLGQGLIEAGNEFGPSTAYGKTVILKDDFVLPNN